MQQSIVGMENIQPYKFSDCSLNDYIDEFRDTRNMCLLNKPNEVSSSPLAFSTVLEMIQLRFRQLSVAYAKPGENIEIQVELFSLNLTFSQTTQVLFSLYSTVTYFFLYQREIERGDICFSRNRR